jgi:probable phosphoglycerate mutase
MSHLIEANGDGVCEPVNPGGHAAWGIRVCVDGKEVHTAGGYCGHGPTMSNNVAEYSAAIAVFKWVIQSDLNGILHLRMDSKLVICQLAGEQCSTCKFKNWKIHGGLYVPFYKEATQLLKIVMKTLGGVKLEWIPREQNSECDYHSKKVLLDMGIKFKIQPEEVKP